MATKETTILKNKILTKTFGAHDTVLKLVWLTGIQILLTIEVIIEAKV